MTRASMAPYLRFSGQVSEPRCPLPPKQEGQAMSPAELARSSEEPAGLGPWDCIAYPGAIPHIRDASSRDP